MTLLLFIAAAAAAVSPAQSSSAECVREATPAAQPSAAVSDTKPIKVSASQNPQTLRAPAQIAPAGDPQTCDHAINTKGTGAAGRSAAPACDHAINTKGTGTSGKAAAPTPAPAAAPAVDAATATGKYSAPVNICR